MLKFLMWAILAGICAIFWMGALASTLLATGNDLFIFFPLSVAFFVCMVFAIFKAFYHFAKQVVCTNRVKRA